MLTISRAVHLQVETKKDAARVIAVLARCVAATTEREIAPADVRAALEEEACAALRAMTNGAPSIGDLERARGARRGVLRRIGEVIAAIPGDKRDPEEEYQAARYVREVLR